MRWTDVKSKRRSDSWWLRDTVPLNDELVSLSHIEVKLQLDYSWVASDIILASCSTQIAVL